MKIAALRRKGVRLAVAAALMLAPLASIPAQGGLYECTTTKTEWSFRIFGITVYRSVESTTICVQIA